MLSIAIGFLLFASIAFLMIQAFPAWSFRNPPEEDSPRRRKPSQL